MVIVPTEKEREDIAAWLSPLNFGKFLADNLNKRTEGTASWIFEDSKLKNWMNGDLNLLWCPGHPGIGKTMIASVVIDTLTKSKTAIPVLFVFCNYKNHYTTSNYLKIFLKQLVLQQFVTNNALKLFKDAKAKSRTLSEADLLNILIEQLQKCSKAFIVVDAFDEILDAAIQDDLSHIFTQITLNTKVHVMVTSRPHVTNLDVM
ncbi:hypothetical protein M422DRAFT_163144 [Sphaerobolus stellatus SS14]|uniref:NACHT domain-containing protein n=1 Tax=Sphaerobolus stellatus (strain SS14) TaxID=990650 RepID=A0A0C9VW37_SPHS4|nr:hypothetical protein M422DRAFT_163144 [Sphaerobolus stellatus SS14]